MEEWQEFQHKSPLMNYLGMCVVTQYDVALANQGSNECKYGKIWAAELETEH